MWEVAPCGKPIEQARTCNENAEWCILDLCINKRVEDLFFNLSNDKNNDNKDSKLD